MPVAIVTGSNKGIGLAIVRALCKQFKGEVYLTSRDEARGKAAVAELNKEGLKPLFHVLDIGKEETIVKLRDFIKEKHGGIDILVNNAGIAFKGSATESVGHQAKVTLGTNYWDNKRVCELLFPLLNPGARVVNVSSFVGALGNLIKWGGNKARAEGLFRTLSDPRLSLETLDMLMTNFVETAQTESHKEAGWPPSTYLVSKIGWSALSRIQQRMMDKDPRPDIVVNHVNPGFVDTDMSSHKGTFTVDRGAQSSVFAALLPPNTDFRGAYIWDDNSIIDWVNGPYPST